MKQLLRHRFGGGFPPRTAFWLLGLALAAVFAEWSLVQIQPGRLIPMETIATALVVQAMNLWVVARISRSITRLGRLLVDGAKRELALTGKAGRTNPTHSIISPIGGPLPTH